MHLGRSLPVPPIDVSRCHLLPSLRCFSFSQEPLQIFQLPLRKLSNYSNGIHGRLFDVFFVG